MLLRSFPVSRTDWTRIFFSEDYVEILRRQKGRDETKREVRFIVKALGVKPPTRILDVGCGFGRHSAALARQGFDVVGLDASRAMLDEADRRWRRVSRLSFQRGDMRHMTFDCEFDAVICIFTTFGYFSDRENRDVLRRMARALKPGGRLLIVHRNPAHDRRLMAEGSRTWQRLKDWFVLQDSRYDVKKNVIDSTWTLLRPGLRSPRRMINRVQEYTMPQWTAMLRHAGLRRLAFWGDYDTRVRPSAQRARLTVLARKTARVS